MRRKVVVLIIAPIALLLCALVLLLALRPHALVRLASKFGGAMTAKVGERGASKVALTPFEQQVAEEINLARANPREYAANLEKWKQACSGKQLKLDAQRTIALNEGAQAIDEAIAYLRTKAQTLPPIGVSQGMSSAAKDHLLDLAHGLTGHRGSDGSLPDQRVSRYGNIQGAVAENISYSAASAREVVVGMIVDDGVPSRGHRLNIFNPNFRTAGVAAAPPTNGVASCVIDFAGGFVERASGVALMMK